MRPLVYWCRWNDARLRLMGRDETAVWGELALPDGDMPFRFNLNTWELTIEGGDGPRSVRLDEMGVEVEISEG